MCSAGSRGDQQVDRLCTPRLSSHRRHGCIHPPVGTRRRRVEWKRFECSFGPLKTILTYAALTSTRGHVRACCQFRKSKSADGKLTWQLFWIEALEINHDGCVN